MSRRFSFPSPNCACRTATFCCASCNSRRATSFAASISRTRLVRQKTRRVREMDAAKEVARLELQLAQQNVAVRQAQFGEGKLNLRDMERARLDENDKWMAYLDANFQRQQAQLDLLKAAGQLDKVWQ